MQSFVHICLQNIYLLWMTYVPMGIEGFKSVSQSVSKTYARVALQGPFTWGPLAGIYPNCISRSTLHTNYLQNGCTKSIKNQPT